MSPEVLTLLVSAGLVATHLAAVLVDRWASGRTPAPASPVAPSSPRAVAPAAAHPVLETLDAILAQLGPRLMHALIAQHLPAVAAQVAAPKP